MSVAALYQTAPSIAPFGSGELFSIRPADYSAQLIVPPFFLRRIVYVCRGIKGHQHRPQCRVLSASGS